MLRIVFWEQKCDIICVGFGVLRVWSAGTGQVCPVLPNFAGNRFCPGESSFLYYESLAGGGISTSILQG
jgi:hypothetical protein